MDNNIASIQEQPSNAQEELGILNSRVEELEQKTTSDAAAIDKLTQELRQCKASEELAKKDVSAIDNLYTASKEDLHKKTARLKEFELKYEREAKINEGIEITLRSEHKKIKHLREKLNNVIIEREAFEAFSAEVNAKLNESVQNLSKTDTRLKQALSCNNEMEQKLKSLEELHRKSCAEAESATQRKLELEGLIQSSNAERNKLKKQLKESETKLESMEHKNMEIEKHLNLLKVKCTEKDQQLKEHHGKTSELTDLLKSSKEENARFIWQSQVSEQRVTQLEHSLGMLSDTKLEHELKLKDLSEECAEYKRKFREAHYRNIELEDMVEKSHSEKMDIDRKVAELENLLKTKHYCANKLEEQLSIGLKKCQDAEAELMQFQDKVSKLQAIAEASQQRSERLEIDLQAANANEGYLTNQLNVITDEQKTFEQSSRNSIQKVLEVENHLEALQFELKSSKEKLEISEKVLEASNVRENEILEKLKLTQEEMEHKGSLAEKATEEEADEATKSGNIFQEQLDEATERGYIFKEQLSEATQREASLKTELEASSAEKISLRKMIDELKLNVHKVELKSLSYQDQNDAASEGTERDAFYQNHAFETTEMEEETSLKSQLEASSTEIQSLEEIIGELTTKVVESDKKIEQISSENEIIANANSKLKDKLELIQFEADELKDTVNLIDAEKEVLEINAKKMETKLLEEIEKLKLWYSEEMNVKERVFSSTEICYEKGLSEVTNNEEIRKIELDGAFMKIEKLEEIVGEFKSKTMEFKKKNEGLSSMNLKPTDELAGYEINLNELKKALGQVLADKEETLGQLHISRKTIEDLRKQLSSEEERLQSKISSVMEVNGKLDEMHQHTKKNLQAIINQLVDQLTAQKADLIVKSEMQARIEELEYKLIVMEKQFRENIEHMTLESSEKNKLLACKLQERDDLAEETTHIQNEFFMAQKQANSRIVLERQASIKQSFGEIEAQCQRNLFDKSPMKNADEQQHHVLLLQNKVQELEQKLRIVETEYLEKHEAEVIWTEPKHEIDVLATEAGHDVKMKSSDLFVGEITSAPSRRKSMKRSKGVLHLHTKTPSTSMKEAYLLGAPIKFIAGIVLVSVVIGVIVGKLY